LETGKRHTMNILLWVLQVLAALLYGSSGVMKVFLFDKVSQDVPSFGALPRRAWTVLGLVELVCTVGLIVPGRVPETILKMRWLSSHEGSFVKLRLSDISIGEPQKNDSFRYGLLVTLIQGGMRS
jgi:hypothetical protein